VAGGGEMPPPAPVLATQSYRHGNIMNEGAVPGSPNYIIKYGSCFNSKRQARRTVSVYEKYKDRVNFVVVNLDQKRSPRNQQLVKQLFSGLYTARRRSR